MAVIRIITTIAAPIERCFELAREIGFHTRSMATSGERAIAGRTSGLIELGESVRWEGRHLGAWFRFTARITECTRPDHFRDEMVAGSFAPFVHDHMFEGRDGGAVMTDLVTFRLPLRPVGAVIEFLYLARYIGRLLECHGRALKAKAESENRSTDVVGYARASDGRSDGRSGRAVPLDESTREFDLGRRTIILLTETSPTFSIQTLDPN